jgi:membrane protein required for colicin V production
MAVWNWLDWVMAIVILLSLITAIRKGLVRELISLAAVVVGIVVASLEYTHAARWFQDVTKSQQVAWAAGFLVVFALVMAGGAAVSLLARFLVQQAGIEWFDRFLGGIFGVIRGVVIDSILLMVMVAFAVKPEVVQTSRLAPYVSSGSRAIAHLMPHNVRDNFYNQVHKFREAVL